MSLLPGGRTAKEIVKWLYKKTGLRPSPTPSFTVTMSSPVHTSTPVATLKMAADSERTNVASDTEGRKLTPLTQLHYDRGQDTIHVYSDEQESY